jgi:hypothetical protein
MELGRGRFEKEIWPNKVAQWGGGRGGRYHSFLTSLSYDSLPPRPGSLPHLLEGCDRQGLLHQAQQLLPVQAIRVLRHSEPVRYAHYFTVSSVVTEQYPAVLKINEVKAVDSELEGACGYHVEDG